MVNQVDEQHVAPFYLQMMGLNAITNGEEYLPLVREASADLDAATVVSLLRREWRPRVMGAWYAPRHDTPQVRAALLLSLETSAGSLAAPALATAAVVLLGPDALPSLDTYAAVDRAYDYGAAGFIAATVQHLGGVAKTAAPDDQDREYVDRMLAVAARLRDE